MSVTQSSRRAAATLIEMLVVSAVIAIVAGLVMAAVVRTRALGYRVQCENHLRQIGFALHGYHDANRALPPGHTYENGTAAMAHVSWCVRLLPFLEQQALWERIRTTFQEHPNFLDAAHTERGHVLDVFTCPADGRTLVPSPTKRPLAFTAYLGVEGVDQYARNGVLYSDSHVPLAHVTDGTAYTLMVGERPPSSDYEIGWWYAGWGQKKDGSAEMVLGTREVPVFRTLVKCPPGSNEYRAGSVENQCDSLHFWSLHPSGSHFLMADASVHFLAYSADSILSPLATRAGGESVTVPD